MIGEKLTSSNLPKGWALSLLDEISVKITDGEHIRPKTVSNGIPFLSAKDVRDEGVVFEDILYVTELDARKFRNRCNPENGDILIVSRGATVGRSCVVKTDRVFCLLGSVILLKISDLLDKKFISYSIKSLEVQKKLINISESTAQQAIYLRDIRNVPIPIPPLFEQRRIVAKIEELFTQLDAGVELLKNLKKKLKRYRQAVLKAAVEGKLTQEWREANRDTLEPANLLLDRILKERREKWEADRLAEMQAKGKLPKDDKWKQKYKEPTAPNIANLPELPKDWCWPTFDSG